MPPILNETVTNSVQNIITDNLNSENINDYMYDQIYVKGKKASNINVYKNKKFIKKYIANNSNNPNPNNQNIPSDLNLSMNVTNNINYIIHLLK
jgi:hypothetical protein